jgi:hypothetical protein
MFRIAGRAGLKSHQEIAAAGRIAAIGPPDA